MKALITGAAGFVAPHVALAFEQAGYEVVQTDIRADAGRGIVRSDLASLKSMLQATSRIDVVCHLGGVGDVYLAFDEPHTAAQANVLGTANLLEACRRNGVGKVVYASTWKVYGNPRYQPLDEEHPCDPDHPYSITKLAGERLAISYDLLKGLPVVGLRLGTVYGRGMRPNSVFSLFVDNAVRGRPITINGSGEQSRQFTHVRDVAAAFLLAAESDVRAEALNIVAEEEISIRRLAEMVTRHLPAEIRYEEARTGDAQSALVSSRKARVLLGWQPLVRFEDGLVDLIAGQLPQYAGFPSLKGVDSA